MSETPTTPTPEVDEKAQYWLVDPSESLSKQWEIRQPSGLLLCATGTGDFGRENAERILAALPPASAPAREAVAHADARRLDWLENEMGLDYKVHLRKGRLAAYIDVSGREYDAAYEGDDLRAAIDAAMSSTPRVEP